MSRDPTCREERRLLGLSYPRSGCHECGTLLRKNWVCAKQAEGLDEVEGYLVIPALPEEATPEYRGVQCGLCRVRFDNVNSHGCFHSKCPLRHRQRT